jgi:hypothetical protein
LTSSL